MLKHAILSLATTLALSGTLQAVVNIAPTDPNIRYVGRFNMAVPSAPTFDWPGTHIECTFTGTQISVKLSDGNNNYDVFIDGVLQPILVTTAATQYDYLGLSAGTHSFMLYQRTENTYAHATFQGFVLADGNSLLPSPNPSRRIEFIGDSLTCGYGNESPSLTCNAAQYRQYENNYLAYGPVAARDMCADYHMSSFSGRGMVRNYGDALQVSAYPMTKYYLQTSVDMQAQDWNFASWTPDVVCIFLGTNDFSTAPNPTKAQYEGTYAYVTPGSPGTPTVGFGYLNLIWLIHSKYPSAQVFCLSDGTSAPGPMDAYIQAVVTDANAAGAAYVHLVELGNDAGYFTGCDYHTNVAGHALWAAALETAIKAQMGWASCPPVGTATMTPTPAATATPGGPGKDYCITLDYSSVPTLLNYRKITLNVSVGTCSSVTATEDGSPIPATYNAGTGMATITASSNAALSIIIITAVGWSSGGTGIATKANLYNNYHWAWSQTFDDGYESGWLNGKSVMQAHSFEGRPWRGGLAFVGSFVGLNWGADGCSGTDMLMSSAEWTAARAAGWDIFNHTWDHPNLTCANFQAEFDQNQALALTMFPGYYVNHVVYPFENDAPVTSACAGWAPSYLRTGEQNANGFNYVDVAIPGGFQGNPAGNIWAANRSGDTFSTTVASWQALAASAAGNARNTWLINITHRVYSGACIGTDSLYSTNVSNLSTYANYLDSNYGAAGNNSMWVAPAAEVADYLMVRDRVVVSSSACGTATPSATPCVACTATPTATMSSTPTVSPTSTPIPACSPLIVDTLEDGNTFNALGGIWVTYGDAPATASAANAGVAGNPASSYGTLHAVNFTGTNVLSGYLHLGTLHSTFSPQLSLGSKDRLIFWIKATSAGTAYSVQIARAAVLDYDNYAAAFTAAAGVWTRIELPLTSFAQGGWGTPVPVGWADLTGLIFYSTTAGAFDISIDDVEFGCPPAPTATRTPTPLAFSPTQTPTRTSSPTSSGTPSVSPTFTDVPPGSTFTGTPTTSPTWTASVTPSPSGTPSLPPTLSPTNSVTSILTPTPTRTSVPTAVSTFSSTPSPSATATPTSTQNALSTATSTSTPTTALTQAPAEGPLEITELLAAPNPNPSGLMLKLSGPAEICRVTIFSKGMARLGEFTAPGRNNPGWVLVPLGTNEFSNGSYYFTASAERGTKRSAKVSAGKLFILR